jgi:hypothetical protein
MKERQKITRFNGISKWLSNSVSESEDKRYTHRLLKEDKSQRDIILDELILIIQKAHEDARYRLRKLAGNSLAPFEEFSESDPSSGYPERLNIISLKGYFGEIFSGIIAENFAPFGQDDWEVPAFLFRFHLVEFQHLEFLNQTEEIAKKRPGRTGDDCLAFLRNSEGVIIASLVCEAKCTTNHYTKMIAEAHKKASVSHIKPVDTPQIIEILQDYDDPFSSEWVNSLRVLWLEKVDINYERCDLISYICGEHPVRNPTWISPDKPHEEYTAKRRLEAVEIHLHEVENLVTTVYSQPAIATPSVNISTQTVQQPDDSEVAKANSDVIVEGEVLQNEMTQPSNEVIALATELQNSLAGSKLTPAIAKLYSQHTRLRAGGKGLTGWREDEAGERLNDAMRLIEAAFIQRETGDTNWRNGMLRAGELFEWLSHPQLNPDILPIRLLAAAVYELAGYPARAAGLLNEDISEGVESEILRSLLKADFPSLLQQLTEYWANVTSSNFQTETNFLWDDTDTSADRFNKLIVKETASSLGILCAKMRWGNEPRLEKAIEKLSDIAKVLLHGHDTYSWLLGKLCAEVTSVYIQTSLRHHLEALSQMITPSGKTFLERYLRQSYQNRKALAWRSQICGIERLTTAESFALCTPTGSGKTTIAEIAILQSLFFETTNSNNLSTSAPLVIYLVPSRALATEVESSLSRVLKRSTNNNVIVTGLYGGTHWGPTDVGRLECLPGKGFEIRYDLLDGKRLEFQEGGQADTPFIPNPFPTYPPVPKGKKEGVEKRLRPYLFWAAMHLAAPDEKGQRRAVLISVTQQPGGYAEDFLKLLKTWSQIEMPSFFKEPIEAEKLEIWQKCLRSCEDYFGTKSREYQLLEKGIIVHHGKMPGLMARLLIDVIDEKIVHLVLATSTLSEGVNLPFETVLISSLRRGTGELNIREFGNLVGRSGRPGFGTEGRSLVLLSNSSTDWSDKEARKRYLSLIGELENQTQAINPNANPLSPLAELLLRLEEQWQLISSSNRQENFFTWLEKTAPLDSGNNLSDAELSAIETLDSLDSILLSAIVEIEQLTAKDLSPNELEEQLQKIWQRSFAHYASCEQERLENLFIRRGRVLKTEIYKDLSQRRRLYRTSLPPRDGNQLLTLYPRLKEQLAMGGDYAIWTVKERFNYIQNIINILTSLSKFKLNDTSRNVSWNEILHWWLDPTKAIKKPKPTQISNWHSYISKNFGYRFNWGLGSVIALAIDEAFGGELVESSLENWSQTGLPWIVFWMKELIVWGTLDPVAAYLLAKVEDVTTRKQAEELAQTYYQYISERETEVNEHLNAINIKNWVEQSFSSVERHLPTPKPPNQINVNLLRDFSKAPSKNWRVVPVEIGDDIQWFDLAGFPLAICQKPEKWQSDFLNTYDFTLDAENRFVSSKIYI